MHPDIQQLLSAYQNIATQVPWLIQGAGGNLSVKVNGSLWVKATGLRFDEVHSVSELVEVPLTSAVDFNRLYADTDSEIAYAQLIKKFTQDSPAARRPSMETGFHVGLPAKYVLHFHSLLAVKFFEWAQTNKQHPFFKKIELPLRWIPYCTPGFSLSKELGEQRESIFILQNHGVILQSAQLDVLAKWQEVETQLAELFDIDPAHTLHELQQKSSMGFHCNFPDAAVFAQDIVRLPAKLPGPLPNPFHAAPGLSRNEQSWLEIWQASAILHHIAPEVKALSPSECAKLCALPTEQVRRQ